MSRRWIAVWVVLELAFAAALLGWLVTRGGGEEATPVPVAIPAGADPPGRTRPDAAPAPRATLPGGGRSVLPEHRVVTLFGAPQAPELGGLGIGTPDQAGRRLLAQADAYAGRVGGVRRTPVMPAMHLVAVIAAADPGADGLYRIRQPPSVIRRYLAAARRADALLILDIQPGRADLMDEVSALEPFLRDPHVSLAIDPEWAMGPDEVPGDRIGSVDAAEVNRVAARLSAIVRRERLPQKLLVVHQFTDAMIARRPRLRPHPGVALTVMMDGIGSAELKRATYRRVMRDRGDWAPGFKLFYVEDGTPMTPREVLALRPRPTVVVYE